jgi:hypothetical protein
LPPIKVMLIRAQAASDWIQTGLVEAAMYSPDQVISSLRQVSGSWGCCLPLYLGANIREDVAYVRPIPLIALSHCVRRGCHRLGRLRDDSD